TRGHDAHDAIMASPHLSAQHVGAIIRPVVVLLVLPRRHVARPPEEARHNATAVAVVTTVAIEPIVIAIEPIVIAIAPIVIPIEPIVVAPNDHSPRAVIDALDNHVPRAVIALDEHIPGPALHTLNDHVLRTIVGPLNHLVPGPTVVTLHHETAIVPLVS